MMETIDPMGDWGYSTELSGIKAKTPEGKRMNVSYWARQLQNLPRGRRPTETSIPSGEPVDEEAVRLNKLKAAAESRAKAEKERPKKLEAAFERALRLPRAVEPGPEEER